MTVDARSYFDQAQEARLSGGFNDTALNFSVAAFGSTYEDGSNGPYVVAIGPDTSNYELVLIQSRSGNDFTIAATGRGFSDTVAKNHSTDELVWHVSSADDFREVRAHMRDTTRDDHSQYVHGVTDKGAIGDIVSVSTANAAGASGKYADAAHVHKLANSSINAVGLFVAGVVDANALATNAVTTVKINALAVTGAKIAAGTIATANYAASSVDATALGANAVTTVKILDANVTTAKLATGAVTPAKISGTPRVRVYNTAAIATSTGVIKTLTFDSERWDTDTMHSTVSNTSRLTATTAGIYIISGHVSWQNDTSGTRQLQIQLNGTTLIATDKKNPKDANSLQHSINTQYYLNAADYVEFLVLQDCGSPLNILQSGNYTPEFAMVWVGA